MRPDWALPARRARALPAAQRAAEPRRAEEDEQVDRQFVLITELAKRWRPVEPRYISSRHATGRPSSTPRRQSTRPPRALSMPAVLTSSAAVPEPGISRTHGCTGASVGAGRYKRLENGRRDPALGGGGRRRWCSEIDCYLDLARPTLVIRSRHHTATQAPTAVTFARRRPAPVERPFE
jgi:hypothetical protein